VPTSGGNNLDRLVDAGVVTRRDIPRPHAHVVEGLTAHEVDVLIAVQKRLEAADEWHGGEPIGPDGRPFYTSFMPY
jgi:hypothetical protein